MINVVAIGAAIAAVLVLAAVWHRRSHKTPKGYRAQGQLPTMAVTGITSSVPMASLASGGANQLCQNCGAASKGTSFCDECGAQSA